MWTAIELKSEHRVYRAEVWRVVEAQNKISTMRLADDLSAQRRLEEMAEQVKPKLPPQARQLHWLLASPFRYGHKSASRFRRADERPGIFYASEAESTALSEVAYWRLRFFSRSPSLKIPRSTTAYTSFAVDLSSKATLDLTQGPFAEHEAKWTDRNNYNHCQELAQIAREAKTECIRSVSARDPRCGCNLAVLQAGVFCSREPKLRNTWHLRCESDRVTAQQSFPSQELYVFRVAELGLPEL